MLFVPALADHLNCKTITSGLHSGQRKKEKIFMGLFKRAAARGVAHELVRRGIVAFPSKEAMDEAADAVADAHEGMPEMSPEAGHSPEDLAAMGTKLIELGHALMEQAGAAAPGSPEAGGPPMPEGAEAPPPPSPEAAKMSADLTKTAAEADYETIAATAAVSCMEKAASEVKQATTGSLVMGGDKGNDPSQAAQHSEIAALDKKQRPEGAYHHGMGKTELDTMKGLIGDMSKNPAGPANSPAGSNSVSKDAGGAKAASLDAELKKIANKLVGLHDGKDKNKLTDSAKHDQIAALDNKNRPQGTYLVGVGNANFSEPQDHRVGKEMPHPMAPKNSPSGTNSVIEASKTSEENAFLVLFKKTAEDVGQYLPTALSEDEKIAAISKMIGFDHDSRQEYLNTLHAEKKAGVDESKHSKTTDHSKYKKDPEHKDEVASEQHKESALLSRIREIAASASAS
jgi:hypothetical protein